MADNLAALRNSIPQCIDYQQNYYIRCTYNNPVETQKYIVGSPTYPIHAMDMGVFHASH